MTVSLISFLSVYDAEAISSFFKERDIPVKQVREVKLDYMAGGAAHQGVIAIGACAEYVEVEDILAIAEKKGEDPFIIICDEIEDPHNLGAIIRTAEAAGAHGIIIPKRRSASLNHTVFKTSAGAASWLPVARVPNLAAAVDELKKQGIKDGDTIVMGHLELVYYDEEDYEQDFENELISEDSEELT